MTKTDKTKAPKVTHYDKGPKGMPAGKQVFWNSPGWVKKPWENFNAGKNKGSIGFRRGAR
jgi:hypothetical protein